MSTVYYTLDMMKKEGLIRELEFYDMENRYESNVSDHINLVCTRCGKITDFTGNEPSFSKAVEKETGFKSSSMRFEYYGICRNCTEWGGCRFLWLIVRNESGLVRELQIQRFNNWHNERSKFHE
jgi:hypothetical protein